MNRVQRAANRARPVSDSACIFTGGANGASRRNRSTEPDWTLFAADPATASLIGALLVADVMVEIFHLIRRANRLPAAALGHLLITGHA